MEVGEITHQMARELDTSEYEIWCRAWCWYNGYGYVEGMRLPVVEQDFGEYLVSLHQKEVTPPYVTHYARTHKSTYLEA